jgi:hypothetical protein
MWNGKAVLAAASIAISFIAGSDGAAAQSLTLHTSPFLLQPEKTIGFEGEINGLSYVESGITVSYVGYASEIWAGSQAAEGQQSWYVNGGGFGFTRIQFGEAVGAFQFAGGTGRPPAQAFARGLEQPSPAIQFRLLMGGQQVAEGAFLNAPFYSGFRAFGFSGVLFDEVHIQSQLGDVAFDEGGLDAMALDALAFGGPVGGVIPEPSTWAMLIIGFGLVGFMARRPVRIGPASMGPAHVA